MGPMTTHTTSALMAVAVTSLALAACGGGEGSGGGKSEQEKFQEAALRHAECMRKHGVNVPDPKPGGGLVFNGDDVDPGQFERAVKACDKEVGKIPAPQVSEKEQREFREVALKHARCMRAHGIDFPDPTFGPNGEVRIEIKSDSPGVQGGPLDDPAFKAADAACRKRLGKPGAAMMGPVG
jgi:hypothetical protein